MSGMVSDRDPNYAQGSQALSLSERGGLRTNADPSASVVAVTKSDSTTYDPPLRGLYIGGVGDVTVLGQSDTVAVTFVGVPAGTVLPVVVSKVKSTGTTATSIVGMR